MSRRRKKGASVAAPVHPGGYGKGGLPVSGARDEGFWLAAGETVAIGPNVQQASLWNNPLTPAINSAVQLIMVELPRIALGGAAAPQRGRLKLDFIDGVVDHYFYGANIPDVIGLYVGLYVGEIIPATNLYAPQDPSNASEVSRGDWIYIEGRAVFMGTVNRDNSTVNMPIFNLTGAVDIELEPGEALMLALASSQVGAGNVIGFMPHIRLHFAEPT